MDLPRRRQEHGPEISPSCARSSTSEPEVGLDLPRTQEKVLQVLDGLPEVSTGTGCTSVTAVLRGRSRSRSRDGAAARRHGRPARGRRRPAHVRLDQRHHARLRARPAHRRAGRRRAPAGRPAGPARATWC